MKTHVLVTGSSGTVGTALVIRLAELGYRVSALDIRGSYWDRQIDKATVHFDLRRPLDRLRLSKRPDLIVHLAANARVHDLVVNPGLARDNYRMVHNVLEYARLNRIPGVLFSSSREVYGESRPGQSREEADTHVSRIKAPYTASKFAAEALIHAYRECYGIKAVIARLSNVYGRFDVSERVVPYFLYRARRDLPLTVFGKEKELDFTFIDDCVDGLAACVERFDKIDGLIFNLSRGRGEKLLNLARLIIGVIGSRSTVSTSRKRVGEISSFVGNIALARKHLGYRPKISLEDGIEPAAEWYARAIKEPRVYAYQRRILAARGWL